MSRSGKVSRIFEFFCVFELLKKVKKNLKLMALASQQSSLVLSQYYGSVLPGKQKFNWQFLDGVWHLLGSLFLNPYDFT